MDTAERTWDASPLIGLVIIIPALFYFSWWWQFTGRFLTQAQRAVATVSRIDKYTYRTSRGKYYYYYTMVEFKNMLGQDTDGQIQDSRTDLKPGDNVDIYYTNDHSDVRFGGLDGVWGGLALVVGLMLLGIGLSIVAWVTTSRRRLPVSASAEEALDEWQEP